MARSAYSNDWFCSVEIDISKVEDLLNAKDPGVAGFFLQQTLEKFLKVFLLSKGWQLKRIHNLETLLDEAVVYAPFLEEFRFICQKISEFYFLESDSFPKDADSIDYDVRDSLNQVKKLIEKFKLEFCS